MTSSARPYIFQVLTQFPERYEHYTSLGLPAKAKKENIIRIDCVQLRDHASPERKGRIDDRPYGGGPGMILEIAPIHRALNSLPHKLPRIALSPKGKHFDQKKAEEMLLASPQGYTFICGYYEGIDERVMENLVDESISIGQFIMNAGDLPALCIIETLSRLLPGYMGSSESYKEESFVNNKLEYPQYTRPYEYQSWKVPEVLTQGNHEKIRKWREEQSKKV